MLHKILTRKLLCMRLFFLLFVMEIFAVVPTQVAAVVSADW